MYGLYASILFVLVLNVLPDIRVVYVAAVLVVLLCIRLLIQNYIVSKQLKISAKIFLSNVLDTRFRAFSSINEYLDNVDRVDIVQGGDNWAVYYAIFDFYGHTRGGDYLSRQVVYTVYEYHLRRELPNVVFDNRRAHGRQFRYRYAGSQKISLEGNFDDVFETYMPNYYKVDSLSFITPEVMQIMLQATEYDIELAGDRLFVYAPVLTDSELGPLAELGNKLGAALDDNIDNYRDSYLTGTLRAQTTSSFARELLKSPVRPAVMVAIMSVPLAGVMYAALTVGWGALFNQISMYVYLLFGGALFKLVKTIRDNNRKERSFQTYIRYGAEHPGR